MTWPRATWPALFALGLGSRILVLCLGMLAPLEGVDAPPIDPKAPPIEAEMDTPLRRPLRPWYRWDALWYLEVAREGYRFNPDRQSTASFMPLLSLCMMAGSAVGLDIFWIGSIAPNLIFALGMVAFGKVALKLSGDDGLAWRSCLLLITYPTSFFFSAPYLESFGFAISAWGLWAWLENRPIMAASFLGLSSAARIACVAPAIGIGAEWLNDLIHGRKPRRWAIPVAAAGAIGIAAFCVYLGFRIGEPFALFKSQKNWGRKSGLEGIALFGTLFYRTALDSRMFDVGTALMVLFFGVRWSRGGRPPGVSALPRPIATYVPPIILAAGCAAVFFAFRSPQGSLPARILSGLDEDDKFAFLLFTFLGLSAWARRGPLWGCSILIPIALAATSGSTMSMARFTLLSYPAFIEAAELLGKRWSFAAALIAGVAGQYYLFVRFARLDGFII